MLTFTLIFPIFLNSHVVIYVELNSLLRVRVISLHNFLDWLMQYLCTFSDHSDPVISDSISSKITEFNNYCIHGKWKMSNINTMMNFVREVIDTAPDLRVRLATADRGLFILSGSPSFHPGTWPDRGLFWTFSQKMSRPPASQSDPTLTWSALDGLVVLWWWFADWIRMMAAGEEGLWGGGDFLRPVKSRLVLVIP